MLPLPYAKPQIDACISHPAEMLLAPHRAGPLMQVVAKLGGHVPSFVLHCEFGASHQVAMSPLVAA